MLKKFFEQEEIFYLNELRNYNNKVLIAVKLFKTFDELKNNYLEVLDIVAGYIQDSLIDNGFDDNLRWNIYLAFVIEEKITEAEIQLIEKIEKDSYCCKKYVLSLKDSEFLNEEIENHLPIFINLDRNDSKGIQTKNGIERNNKEFPKIIKDYLAEKTITLEKFLEMRFDLKLIKEIYKGEKNEN